MNITAYNIETDGLEKTYLTKPHSAGVTALTVKNNNKFATTLRILIGDMGTEKAEILTTAAPTGNGTVNVTSPTIYDHPVDTPIYVLTYDQIKFYRSTTGVAGAYTILATVDMDVDNAEKKTVYADSTALSTYYYEITYYNSLTTGESDYSDPIPGSDYGYGTVGKIINDFYEEYGLEATSNITYRTLINWLNKVNDDLETRVKKPYDFMLTREAFSRTANARTLAFPTFTNGNPKMWKFQSMRYNYTDTTTDPDTDETYPVRIVSLPEFEYKYQDNTVSATTVDDQLQIAALDDSVNLFRFYPPSESTASAVFYIKYWKYITRFDSDADVIETPSPKIYEDYIRYRYFLYLSRKDSSYQSTAKEFNDSYNLEVGKLPRSNRKDAGSPRSFGLRGGLTYKGFRRF